MSKKKQSDRPLVVQTLSDELASMMKAILNDESVKPGNESKEEYDASAKVIAANEALGKIKEACDASLKALKL